MDIVVYGNDLEQYLRHEFLHERSDGPLREIRFWTGVPSFWD